MVLIPLLFLFVMIFAGVFFIKVGVPRVSSQRQKLADVQKEEAILFEKDTLLSQFEKSITKMGNTSLSALPSKNPATSVISALRNLSSEKGVIVGSLTISSGKSDENSISSATVGFDLDTQVSGVFDFIRSLNNTAPINRLEVISLNQDEASSVANISLKIYWSSLPGTLPALTDPLPPLGDEEQSIISEFASLKRPSSFGEVTPTGPSGRADPFN